MPVVVEAGKITNVGHVGLVVKPQVGRIHGYIDTVEARGKVVSIDGHPSSGVSSMNDGFFIVDNLSPGTYYSLEVDGFQPYSL